MMIPIVAFFNNKGGVGKTSLIYHLAWMYADLGLRVVAGDLDPQANLTAAFLDDDVLEDLWTGEGNDCRTIYDVIGPLIRGIGDIGEIAPMGVAEGNEKQQLPQELVNTESPLALLPGELTLSRFEDDLSEQWPKCLDGQERAFRVTSAFWRILQAAGRRHRSNLILIDIGPNLGAINRAALIAADYVAIPLAPDLFSLQGLRNLGPTLAQWREGWGERLKKRPQSLPLPEGRIQPIGYVVLQHAVRLDRPVRAYQRWASQIPSQYRESVLTVADPSSPPAAADPYCLALLKHYRSLMPMAQEARKPIFHLNPADGAIGSHFDAARSVSVDFEQLARRIAERINLRLPWGADLGDLVS